MSIVWQIVSGVCGFSVGFALLVALVIIVLIRLDLYEHVEIRRGSGWAIAKWVYVILVILFALGVIRKIASPAPTENAPPHHELISGCLAAIVGAIVCARFSRRDRVKALRSSTQASTRHEVAVSSAEGGSAKTVTCPNCGQVQREGDWEREMDHRTKAQGMTGFVNLSAPPQCLKCCSTIPASGSAPKRVAETPSQGPPDIAARFSDAARQWAEAHARAQSAVSMSSDDFRAVSSSTQIVKDAAEKEIGRLIGEARSKNVLDDVLRLLQERGQSGALYLIDAYL